jgi:hypothetical protein
MTLYKSLFPALMEIDKSEVPIFIPTFNQPSLLKMTLLQLAGHSNRIVIFDNNSTYPPMLELLDQVSKDVDVVMSSRNHGPRIFTEDAQILSLMPDYFIVTDPDLIYNNDLPSNYIDEMKKVMAKYNLAKVGFALEVYQEEEIEKFQNASVIKQVEEIYWQEEIGKTSTNDIIYNAFIDTTFALNNRDACLYHNKFGRPTFRYPSARIAGRYTCDHVGWWRKDLIPQESDELEFYLKHQKWSHTERFHYK